MNICDARDIQRFQQLVVLSKDTAKFQALTPENLEVIMDFLGLTPRGRGVPSSKVTILAHLSNPRSIPLALYSAEDFQCLDKDTLFWLKKTFYQLEHGDAFRYKDALIVGILQNQQDRKTAHVLPKGDPRENTLANWSSLIVKPIRVLSYQSPAVWEILRHSEYCAVPDLRRAPHDYHEDTEQLGGAFPIWGFADYDGWIGDAEQVSNGKTLFTMHCESGYRQDAIGDLVLLDLMLPRDSIHEGRTHNACKYAVVFPVIKPEYVQAAYRVTYDGDHTNSWYYPAISVLSICGDNPLFTTSMICRKS